MPLTKSQQTILERARSVGSGGYGLALTEPACVYLIAVIAEDLGLRASFPEFKGVTVEPLYSRGRPADMQIRNIDFLPLFERLVKLREDSDTYFSCLAALHKARTKYARILESQPLPTLEQVGPRSLLQAGSLSYGALASFLLWRKWLFDIDNRAGQETGYVFEPIIAHAIGGTPVGSARSPIRRHDDPRKGRQVDCIRNKMAYEFKVRVTIAASGQGRWREELDFPIDCKQSGYKPVLVVLDSTPNPKLDELRRAFTANGGQVYIGADAWAHLRSVAGKTMGLFVEKYVHAPLAGMLKGKAAALPGLSLSVAEGRMTIKVGRESLVIPRRPLAELQTDDPEAPDDEADDL